MSSEDVITLESSDEDTEPAPKKPKTSPKPQPNAMVCIPKKIHGVTIKPAKLNSVQLPKGLGKGITVKKVIRPDINKAILNIKELSVKPAVPNTFQKNKVNAKQTTLMNQSSIPVMKPTRLFNNNCNLVRNPLSTSKVSANNSVMFMKSTTIKPIKIGKTFSSAKGSKSTSMSSLSSNITVKTSNSLRQPIIYMKNITAQRSSLDEVTVLDDDEGPSIQPISVHPLWYIRPEEDEIQQKDTPKSTTSEKENNKEPDSSKMIEITIEDSPLKPGHNKRTTEVGAELAITINDSPIKLPVEKEGTNSGSDAEEIRVKKCHSKKKLEYPKNVNTVEIEIEPYIIDKDHTKERSVDVNTGEMSSSDMQTKNCGHNINKSTKNATNKENTTLSNKGDKNYEIVQKCTATESYVTFNDKIKTTSNDKNEETKQLSVKNPINKCDKENNDNYQFHPVYQSFINLCFELENSDDMKKIVEKKIKGYYLQVPKTYTESEEFVDMVSSKILAMKAGPDKMYLYIKDIVDELNLQRKMAKSQVLEKENKIEEQEPCFYGMDSEYDRKRQRQIRKLEKTIKKLSRAIQKLEEQEVDFDDEDDSVYLLTERYKERMVRVYAKFCQLTNTKMPSEPRIQIDARPGQPTGPAKRLEKLINKKVPIGTPLPFPDFHDVLLCVKEANVADNLGWNDVDIMEEARDLFMRCGRKLQRRRQENEWRLAASRIAVDVSDPAEKNTDLKNKLDENKKLAATRESEIIKKYADRQNQLKLEAEEIGDKEAEESPVESEEDDDANDGSVRLEDREKRKERLKRLLHETSKKNESEKENQASNKATCKIVSMVKDEGEVKKEETPKIIKESTSEPVKEHDTANTETLTVSDESDNLDSDIDELHLLQRLHSSKSHSSSFESSDSESAIAISDSLESSDDNKKPSDDIISIENSSYSEHETDEEVDENAGNIENKKLHCKNKSNEDYIEPGEDILLASSGDDENTQNNDEDPLSIASVNLIDYTRSSIDETVVDEVSEKTVNDQNLNIEESVGLVDKKYTDIKRSDSTNQTKNIVKNEINDIDNLKKDRGPNEVNLNLSDGNISESKNGRRQKNGTENSSTSDSDEVELITSEITNVDSQDETKNLVEQAEKYCIQDPQIEEPVIDNQPTNNEEQEIDESEDCHTAKSDDINNIIIKENVDISCSKARERENDENNKECDTIISPELMETSESVAFQDTQKEQTSVPDCEELVPQEAMDVDSTNDGEIH